jgi:choline dehydrogenase-like flavoprotein
VDGVCTKDVVRDVEESGICTADGSAIGYCAWWGLRAIFIDPETNTRSYSATAFYPPNAHRTNLSLLVEAYVNKIELEASESGSRAAGVQFTTQGKQFTVRARREVIVCAGTVKSPQLLELSGIGSPALPESHGISVMVANEGVGENLRDHPASPLAFELADSITSRDSLRDPAVLEKAKREFDRTALGQWHRAFVRMLLACSATTYCMTTSNLL